MILKDNPLQRITNQNFENSADFLNHFLKQPIFEKKSR